jgi:hypothetical protein
MKRVNKKQVAGKILQRPTLTGAAFVALDTLAGTANDSNTGVES